MKYRKKPVVVEASQWFVNGDHPEDGSAMIEGKEGSFRTEGKVVLYYRSMIQDGKKECRKCGKTMNVHGWIDTAEGGHTVCPGDWIITGVKGDRYPVKPDIFSETYALEECGRAPHVMGMPKKRWRLKIVIHAHDLDELGGVLRNVITTAQCKNGWNRAGSFGFIKREEFPDAPSREQYEALLERWFNEQWLAER